MPPPVAAPGAETMVGGESTSTRPLAARPLERETARTGTPGPSGRRWRAHWKVPSAAAVAAQEVPALVDEPPETSMVSPGSAVPETVSGKLVTRPLGSGSSVGGPGVGVGVGVSAGAELSAGTVAPASDGPETSAGAVRVGMLRDTVVAVVATLSMVWADAGGASPAIDPAANASAASTDADSTTTTSPVAPLGRTGGDASDMNTRIPPHLRGRTCLLSNHLAGFTAY